jgi:hypothetical protein
MLTIVPLYYVLTGSSTPGVLHEAMKAKPASTKRIVSTISYIGSQIKTVHMKKAFCIMSLTTVLLLLLSTFSVYAQSVNVTGKWNMKVETSAGSGTPVFVLKQTGETVTGTYSGQLGEAAVTGTVKEKTIKLEFKAGDYNVVYTGTVDGDTVKGKLTIGDAAEGTFSGVKETK